MDQLLFDLNPNPVLIYVTGDLRILKVNKAFLEKYGYEEGELDSLTIRDLRPKEDVKELENVLGNLQYEGINHSGVVRHQAKDGELFYVKVSSHAYQFNEKDARLVVIHDITDRVEAERRAKKAFEELNHHFNNSPLAMIKWDADFHILEWSKRAEEITGYSRDAVMGRTPHHFRFYSNKDLQVVENNMEVLITGQQDKTNFEIEMYSKDGTLVNLSVHASALREDNGSLISVLTFIEDITEQKKTELRYQRLFENANDGIFIMDAYQFIECNDEVCNIFGCTKDDILGKTPMDFSPEYQPDGRPSREKAQEKVDLALEENPQVFEWKHKKLDGTLIDVEVSLNRLELANKVYVQAIVRDLTEQKKAQEQLRKNEQLFRKLFLKAPGAMIMVDKENRVKMVNQSFEELFGYTQEELIGQDLDEVIVAKNELESVPRMPGKEFKDGKFYSDVARYTKAGKKLHLLLGAIPVFLDDEPIAGFGIYVDITEQKEYERKLQESVKEKQVLLEEIHHRVKNNLAIVSGLLQMQVLSVDDVRLTNFLQVSQLRIQSMAIVHEMLYQSKNLSEIQMDRYVERLVEQIADTLNPQHQDIEVHIESDKFVLNINQAIPCALIINELVTNSFEFAFEDRSMGTIEVLVSQKDDVIEVEERDDGRGLPDNFDEMRKTSLGMSLIENLTKQLGTKININTGDWGTSFKFCFTKADDPGSSSSGRISSKNVG
ncbi:MAG TPA: PAS domain S-box protein [Balneolaceae bacterium]|nr:PAS domain S-box protein [Balneolaceae bacterium]